MRTIGRWLAGAFVALLVLTPRSSSGWVVTPEYGYGLSVQITSSGDIVSAGESIGSDMYDFSVRLQRGTDGSDVWHYQLDGTAPDDPTTYDYAGKVVVDAAGDVIAAGAARNTSTGFDLQVVKLGGADGVPIWSRALDSPAHANDGPGSMALHPGGDVVVAGVFGNTPAIGASTVSVARLAGATGAVLWQHDVAGNPRASATSVDFDADGNVLATGDLETMAQVDRAIVLKLDGTTGAELWRTILDGGNPGNDSVYVGAVDAAGNV